MEQGFATVLTDWGWWILAAVLAIIELILPGIFFIWLAAAAALVALVMLIVPLPLVGQLAAFAGAALIAVLIGRRWAVRHQESDHPLLNERGLALVGRRVSVADAIVNGRGSVKLGDTIWRAEGPDLPVGATVEIVGSDGSLLRVAPIADEKSAPTPP